MQTIINQGNILPFYIKKEHQNQYIGNCGNRGYGIIGLSGYGVPFQIILSGTIAASSISLAWIDDNNVPIQATGYALDIKHTNDNRTIITYYGGGISPALSGLYTLVLNVGATVYYSEQLRLVDSLNCYQQLVFSHNCPIGKVYYDGAYSQVFYFKGYLDQPVIEREEEAVLNGANELIIKSSNTKTFDRLVASPIIDTLIYPLSIIRDHNTIIYYPDQSGLSYFVKEVDVSFSAQDNGCFSNAEITFLCENMTNNACCDSDIEITNKETKTVS